MKILIFTALLFVAAVAQRCPRECTREYVPVCASFEAPKIIFKMSFANKCLMEIYGCENNYSE